MSALDLPPDGHDGHDAPDAPDAPDAVDDLHLVCRVGDAEYALPARRVLEMETYHGATRVPGTAPWVTGLVQVRGRVIPAVDLRARLGLPPAPRTLDTRVVLVEQGARVVGLVVDSAREVLRIPGTEQPAPAPNASPGGFVRGLAQAGDRLLLLIDLDSVLVQELMHGDDSRDDHVR